VPNKEIVFENLLKELGYKDDSPILPQENKRYQQTNFRFDSGAIAVYSFIIFYENKKSYLWLEFLDSYEDAQRKQRIRTLAERIKFNEKTRLAEVGYEAKYTQDPSLFSHEERKNLLLNFIKITHDNLKNGMTKLSPQPGDILVAKPYGPKIDQGFTESSITIGTRQRAIVAKKFGFGELYNDGFQYARYDEKCILRPI